MSDLIPSVNFDFWKARAAELERENAQLREALRKTVAQKSWGIAEAALQEASDDDRPD